jgi:hypothetical protein
VEWRKLERQVAQRIGQTPLVGRKGSVRFVLFTVLGISFGWAQKLLSYTPLHRHARRSFGPAQQQISPVRERLASTPQSTRTWWDLQAGGQQAFRANTMLNISNMPVHCSRARERGVLLQRCASRPSTCTPVATSCGRPEKLACKKFSDNNPCQHPLTDTFPTRPMSCLLL